MIENKKMDETHDKSILLYQCQWGRRAYNNLNIKPNQHFKLKPGLLGHANMPSLEFRQ